jgi:hypothetical protein
MAGTMTGRALVGGGTAAVLAAGAVASGAVPGRIWARGRTVELFTAVPHGRPQIVSHGEGAHTRAYWDSVTLPAFAFVGGALGKAAA